MKTRTCHYCNTELPLTSKYFHRSNKKRNGGFKYICKECRNAQRRSFRFKQDAVHGSTIDELRRLKRENKTLISKYGESAFNKARSLFYASTRVDKDRKMSNDLTVEWILENIYNKKCVYCDEASPNTGMDRINNGKEHSRSNVVPCCPLCNKTRMNNYSAAEMKLLGKAIKEIKEGRKRGDDRRGLTA